MSENLRVWATQYLALRRAVGYQPCDQEWLISRFLDYLESQNATAITVRQALEFACLPHDARPRWWSQRLAVVRGFSAHVHSSDPDAAELIPTGLLQVRAHRSAPFLYTPAEISNLIGHAQRLHPQLRAQTLATVIGLMAATGMRTSEAVALDTTNIDIEQCSILVLGKGGTKRVLPVHSTTMAALAEYRQISRRLAPPPQDNALFITKDATRSTANSIQIAFRAVATDCHLRAAPGNRQPRLHDLRHTFAVNTLIDAHRDAIGVQARIAALATYLGHASPEHTFWYLTASPELLELVNDRIESYWHGDRA